MTCVEAEEEVNRLLMIYDTNNDNNINPEDGMEPEHFALYEDLAICE